MGSSVLGSFGGVDSMVLPEWGLLVVVKLVYSAKPYSVGEYPFRCFGRPWRFLLGAIQYRVIESVLMTSRLPIIYYTLCYILYTVCSRVYTIYSILYSVYTAH